MLALLAGSAVVFAVTESLKLERAPVAGTVVDKVFSPVCDCPQARARIAFRLRKVDSLTVSIVDEGGRTVRRIVERKVFNRGPQHFFWDGRDDGGRVVREGTYRPKVRLSDAGRTIVLPNPIRVDVTPPRVTLVSLSPRVFSPGGDGRNDRITARYRVSERASVFLTVEGKVRVRKRGERAAGRVQWNGTVEGRRVPQGTYDIRLAAVDRAGNPGPPTRRKPVLVRYIALGRDEIETTAGRRFGVRVLTDVRTYTWRFAGRAGGARGERLRLRAPARPGAYQLTVFASGFSDQARVVVREVAP